MAVVLVVLFHGWWGAPWMGATAATAEGYAINYGRTGVHLFFVLSGFLLFLPYARWAYNDHAAPAVTLFYQRRILRVGPAYWLCLLLLSLGILAAHPTVIDVALHAVFLSNVRPTSLYSINGVFWTMAVEVQFYALLPVIGWAVARLAQRVRPMHPFAAMATVYAGLLGVSLVSGLLEHHGHIHSPFLITETALPHWLDVFGDGMVAAVVYTGAMRVQRRVSPIIGAILAGGGVVTALALAVVPRLHALSIKGIVFGWAYMALVLGVLWGPEALRAVFSTRPLRFIGLISYSVYLWHSVIAQQVIAHLGVGPSLQRTAETAVLTLVISLPVAYISYTVAERPFIAARRRSHESLKSISTTRHEATVALPPVK